MARDPEFLSPHNIKQKKSQLQSSLPLWSLLYLRQSLWKTIKGFLRHLLLNFWYKRMIPSDSQWLIKTFTAEKNARNLAGELHLTKRNQFETNMFFNTFLSEVLTSSLVRFFTIVCRRHVIQFNEKVA